MSEFVLHNEMRIDSQRYGAGWLACFPRLEGVDSAPTIPEGITFKSCLSRLGGMC
jgi:hypothetical protein